MRPERPYKRSDRVKSLVQSALGEIILREVEFSPGTLATITDIDLSKKLDFAKVFIGVIPSQAGEEALRLLTKRAPYLQHLLLKKINIKPLPTISFVLDKGVQSAAGVEKLLLDEESKNS